MCTFMYTKSRSCHSDTGYDMRRFEDHESCYHDLVLIIFVHFYRPFIQCCNNRTPVYNINSPLGRVPIPLRHTILNHYFQIHWNIWQRQWNFSFCEIVHISTNTSRTLFPWRCSSRDKNRTARERVLPASALRQYDNTPRPYFWRLVHGQIDFGGTSGWRCW